MSRIKIVLINISFILIMSCNSPVQTLSSKDFDFWIQDSENGLHRVKEVLGIKYDLQYFPIKHYEGEEIKENKNIIVKFLLKMSVSETRESVIKYNLSSIGEYEERIKYFTNHFKNDVKLISNEKNIRAIDLIYERSYDLLPYDSFLVIFEIDKEAEFKEKVIVIEDKIFGNDFIKFKISKEALEIIPKIRE